MTIDFYLETKRLIIRPLQVSDYSSWFEGFSNRLPSQHAFDEGLLEMSIATSEWFSQLVDHHHRLWQKDNTYILAIFDKNNRHLGMINIATLARANFNWGELGYAVHNYLWRQGIAYEALSNLLPYLEDHFNFHRLEAHINSTNYPSQQLIQKLGFHFEVTREKFSFENGKWTDKDIFFLNLHDKEL